jgi:hypothetical protein
MRRSNDTHLAFDAPPAGRLPRRATLAGLLSLAGSAAPGCARWSPVPLPDSAPPALGDAPYDGVNNYLLRMGEPSLRAYRDPSAEVYRVLWVRSFHRPIALRAESIGSHRTLYVKRLGGSSHYEGGWSLDFSRRRAILGFEWRRLRALIDEALYSQLDGPGVLMHDGAQWTLEAMRAGHYTRDGRQSPCDVPTNRHFCEACRYFVDLGGPNLYHSRSFY